MLNAKQHEKDAEIVAQAGKLGAVTIATNMAGRGTDIIIGGISLQPSEIVKIIYIFIGANTPVSYTHLVVNNRIKAERIMIFRVGISDFFDIIKTCLI